MAQRALGILPKRVCPNLLLKMLLLHQAMSQCYVNEEGDIRFCA